MNTEKVKSVIKTAIIIILIFLAGIIIGQWMIGGDEGLTTKVDMISNAILFIISTAALVISLITYVSIDAVDKKNRMDNNVLERTEYNVAYPEAIRKLNVVNQETYNQVLYDSVIKKPHIVSCMKFADWIQNIVDNIIWFAYYEWEDEDKRKFIDGLYKELNKYSNTGSAIKLLLEENVKLINRVVNYQENRKNNEGILSKLEDVRYKLLPNPVTKIVYYDYLGLDYRNIARDMMCGGSGCVEFSTEYYRYIKAHKTDIKKECNFLIEMAKENFMRAEELSENDILWRGYLRYNLIRCRMMQFALLGDETDKTAIDDIISQLDECIITRKNVCYLVREEGFLTEMFENELRLAEGLKEAFCKVYKVSE